MASKFKRIKLETLDLESAKLDIVVNRSSIFFSNALVAALGNPEFVQYKLNWKEKIFAVSPCAESDINAVRFFNDNHRTITTNAYLVDLIRKGIGGAGYSNKYRVTGTFDGGTVYFDLSEARLDNLYD